MTRGFLGGDTVCGRAGRWHREGNYSIGGRIRGLPRDKTLTDREALALTFPLREAQEIIAARRRRR